MIRKSLFDCFIFFNELDLLEIRLEECYEYIDYFVLCEATRTFRGAPKPLFFEQNRSRFERYLSKIRHVVVDDMPVECDPWQREYFQRNALKRGITDAAPDDMIIVSDCDEIIKPETLQLLRQNAGYFMLDMPMFQFYMNMMAVPEGWNKVYAYSFSLHGGVGDYNDGRRMPEAVYSRFPGLNHRVPAAGWHFTFLGGAARVVEKIRAYSHAETWQQRMLKAGGVDLQMMLLKDVGGGRFLEYRDIDASFPKAIRRRQPQLTELGLIKSANARITELRALVAQYERDKQNLFARNLYLETEVERLCAISPTNVNIALNKPALQSSVSRWSIQKNPADDAKGGNDGRITELYGFHTAEEENPWWQVDLESVYSIHAIRIFNRHDQAYRLIHFSILGSLDGQNWVVLHRKIDDAIFGANLEPHDVTLRDRQAVRYVRIQLDGKGFLHFHECLIFGEPAGVTASRERQPVIEEVHRF